MTTSELKTQLKKRISFHNKEYVKGLRVWKKFLKEHVFDKNKMYHKDYLQMKALKTKYLYHAKRSERLTDCLNELNGAY